MTHYIRTGFAIFIIGLASEVNAQVSKVILEITVEKRAYGQQATQPFHGVGTFDLLLGATPLEGASCPSRSNSAGKVTCVVPCKDNDILPMLIRVRPPSDQDSLGGWVTPTAQDVEVVNCVARPANLTMLYEDARYALDNFLSNRYFAKVNHHIEGDSTAITKSWVTAISDDTETSAITAEILAHGKTSAGREEIFQLHKLATEASKAPELQNFNLSPQDKELTKALARWQILSKSALLQSQISQTLPSTKQSELKLTPTTDLSTYRQYLALADAALEEAERSSEQQKLADDVSTLRSLPAIGPGAAAANQIIEAWK